MAKKVFSSTKATLADLLEALQSRNMVRLEPPLRSTQKTLWDGLIGALLVQKCDLIVRIIDEQGARYERVRGKSPNAIITRKMGSGAVEYVLRPSAETPKWASE